MSVTRHHAEWLSLLEVSGPFLSMPVLLKVFPQGLDAHDPEISRALRFAYEEWDDNQTGKRPNPVTHGQFIRFVLTDVLKVPEESVREGQTIPQTLKTYVPEQGEILRPDLAICDPDADPKPRLLIQIYPHGTDLEKPLPSKHWKATPATRMMELLHGTDCRLGLITNGERWMLVDAPRGESTGFASWYASLWLEEHITLRSFRSLLSGHRFFVVAAEETLEAMLAESAVNQQEVTEQLGYQVRQAVEVLVESIDKADQDLGRELTKGINEKVLYEAALAVMMRLVFLMSAEERKLLLLGDPIYDQHYAISTLQAQLRETADQHGEEILEHRFDAWCRLLATFRAVHAGMQHDRMTLPAYGGHLFDPDRYPFLEGRKSETSWKTTQASPLPINNRTVLHALEALQFLQVKVNGGGPAERRRLSFRALDVEQIGHVYEGLLDHTAKRASEPILGLRGRKDKEPEIALAELERKLAEDHDEFYSWLKEETGRTETALRGAFTTEVDGHDMSRFQAACGNDNGLLERVHKFAGLVREDSFGYPIVILPGSVYVTTGEDRRTTGTHYTPKSLTEPIVRYTLEPLVYSGAAEGKPRQEWKLRSAHELLGLRICDMTTGSGAFLAQACRYLSERLLEAWEDLEAQHPDSPGITPEGEASSGLPTESLIPKDRDERLVYARRIVAQRSLYGVDKNPLAVEMAKLSIWLLTLAKDKPFTFLDHNLRCGDSLVGIDLEQLKAFNLCRTGTPQKLFLDFLPKRVEHAAALRRKISETPASTVADIANDESLLNEATEETMRLKSVADLLVASEFSGGSDAAKDNTRAEYSARAAAHFQNSSTLVFQAYARDLLSGQPTFHWQLEFPEVFEGQGGFDAIVGNPPFVGGRRLLTTFGEEYRNWLGSAAFDNATTNSDLVAFFFRRAFSLVRLGGYQGLIATKSITESHTCDVGLRWISEHGGLIYRAVSNQSWPGDAGVRVSVVHIAKDPAVSIPALLNEQSVTRIDPTLVAVAIQRPKPRALNRSSLTYSQGSMLYGDGFVISAEEAESLVRLDPENKRVLFRYLNGESLNNLPDLVPREFVINFGVMEKLDAERFTEPFRIVTERVKPARGSLIGQIHESRYWLFWDKREKFYTQISSMERIIATAIVTKHLCFSFVPVGWVYSHQLKLFAIDQPEYLALLQSSVHELWARKHSSYLGQTLRYSTSAAFDTFPWPQDLKSLRAIGSEYHETRKLLMEQRIQGLTALYNDLHDPNKTDPSISKMRNLHMQMDEAVLIAYGWTDLVGGYGFGETREGSRYTFSEPVREELLERLLELNQKLQIMSSQSSNTTSGKRKNQRSKVKTVESSSLFS